MPSTRRERIITVSGKNGYVQLLPEEQKALRIEVYFTATNVGETNYYSYEWYKERTLYGRFKIAHGEYTSKEKLCQYQNELLYSEEATLFEVVKRLQCERQRQYRVNKFLVETLGQFANSINLVYTNFSDTLGFDEIPPQPIEIPGLQMDGIYYNMFPGCAGNLVFQSWYDNDICKDVNGKDLTRDNRGKAPEPAFTGRPPSGNDASVPKPTYDPGGTYKEPDPGTDEPTDTITDPSLPKGEACRSYLVTIQSSGTIENNTGTVVTQRVVLYGKIGSPRLRRIPPNLFQVEIPYGIGCTDPDKPPRNFGIAGGNYSPAYEDWNVVIVSME